MFSKLKPYSAIIIFSIFTALYLYQSGGMERCISWDVLGYYLYLPLTFIYNDVPLTDFQTYAGLIKDYGLSDTFYQVVKTDSGLYIDKYTMGMSVLYSPFFFIGDIIAQVMDYPRDGFSAPYQVALYIGSYFYTIAGGVILVKILKRFYSVAITIMVSAIIIFGTNFFMMTIMGTTMPHNYLFFLYGLLLLYTIKWHEQQRTKYIIVIGVVLGLLILSRPSEIVALFIPLLWGVWNMESFKLKWRLLKENKSQMLLAFLVMLCIGIPQLIYWKVLTGHWLVTDYGNPAEGFDWLSPHVLDSLFSYRKGWFVYTPIAFISFIGFYFVWKYKKQWLLSYMIFWILNIYIISSWSCWWYASSFGNRAYIQSTILLALPLAELVKRLKNKGKLLKYGIISLSLALAGLNLFQTYQFKEGVIHPSRMTKDYYWAVFGKTDVSEADKEKLLVYRNSTGEMETLPPENERKLVNSFEFKFDDLDTNDSLHLKSAFQSKTGTYVNTERAFSKDNGIPYSNMSDKDYAWIELKGKIKPTDDFKKEQFTFVYTFQYDGKNYKYRGLDSQHMDWKVGEWNDFRIVYLTPEMRTKDDIFKFYLWNRGKQYVALDEIVVNVYEDSK